MGNLFKDIGHSVSKGSKSIGQVFKSGGKKIEGAVSDVYHDTRSAVAYGGKHLINDVDKISDGVSNLTNPILIYGIGAVVLLVVLSQRR